MIAGGDRPADTDQGDRQPWEIHLTVDAAADAATLLASASGLTKTRVKQVMQRGAVWWQQGDQVRRLRRAKRQVAAGEQLHLYYDARVLAMEPQAAILIADEGSYSVWNKPAGMLSQGSKWGDYATLTRYAEQHLTPERNAFLVHRLDRDARGLMVVAHTKSSARELSRQFQHREVTKIYRAQVSGRVPENSQSIELTEPLDGKPAQSQVTLLGYDQTLDCSWVSVNILTGRKHQVRRHLAGAGWPIMGDRRYGESRPEQTAGVDSEPPGLQLVAAELTLTDPQSAELRHYQLPADRVFHTK
ncbi:MAG: RNA pseudouridine synthase [Gammaproteobacteria bacterium]